MKVNAIHNPQRPRRIVVQASGGIESTTLLAMAADEVGRDNVFPIAFDTDSIFWRHRDSVAVKRVVTMLQMQQNLFVCRMPQADFMEYPVDENYADVGFIPGFKMLFNTASLAFAQRVGADTVWIGNMSDNVFGDETPEFISNLNTLYNCTYPELPSANICTPFFGYTKAEVIREAVRMNVDLAQTVSCGDDRLSGGYNCGDCPWCSKRIKGFNDAGVTDNTRYLFGRAEV